jgi:putative NADPH-quinone reductase
MHFGHALAGRYVAGARSAGHEIRTIEVARLDFPLLRTKKGWESEPVPPGLAEAQQAIGWAEHLVVFFPLWLGDMPALLKGFLEQVARPGFAFAAASGGGSARSCSADVRRASSSRWGCRRWSIAGISWRTA